MLFLSGYSQPIDGFVMCKLVDKLVYHAIYTNRAAYKLQLCIHRILEDEVIPIEFGQSRPANTTGELLLC
jgi:hypothetical protein